MLPSIDNIAEVPSGLAPGVVAAPRNCTDIVDYIALNSGFWTRRSLYKLFVALVKCDISSLFSSNNCGKLLFRYVINDKLDKMLCESLARGFHILACTIIPNWRRGSLTPSKTSLSVSGFIPPLYSLLIIWLCKIL